MGRWSEECVPPPFLWPGHGHFISSERMYVSLARVFECSSASCWCWCWPAAASIHCLLESIYLLTWFQFAIKMMTMMMMMAWTVVDLVCPSILRGYCESSSSFPTQFHPSLKTTIQRIDTEREQEGEAWFPWSIQIERLPFKRSFSSCLRLLLKTVTFCPFRCSPSPFKSHAILAWWWWWSTNEHDLYNKDDEASAMWLGRLRRRSDRERSDFE